jgi:hypothetical protein
MVRKEHLDIQIIRTYLANQIEFSDHGPAFPEGEVVFVLATACHTGILNKYKKQVDFSLLVATFVKLSAVDSLAVTHQIQ